MTSREDRLLTWTKVVLLRICLVLTAIRRGDNAVLAFMIGMADVGLFAKSETGAGDCHG